MSKLMGVTQMHGVIGAMDKQRLGRRRKAGPRHPSGEVVRARVDYVQLAGRQPHRNWLPERFRTDPKAATLLGCLNLFHCLACGGKGHLMGGRPCSDCDGCGHVLSDEQAEAGRLFATAVAAYRAVLCGPKGAGHGNLSAECNPEACDPIACKCLQAQSRYTSAFEALARAGRPAQLAVKAVAIQEWPANLVHLKVGLNALARHFGLDSRRVVRHSINIR